MSRRTLPVAGLIITALLAGGAADKARGSSLARIRDACAALQRQYAKDLGPIAQDLRDSGATEAAAKAWDLARPLEGLELITHSLPETTLPEIPTGIPPERRNALVRFRAAREDQAIALQALARRALSAGSVSYAFSLIRAAARQDPDNAVARGVLGFVRYQDRWVSPFAARMLRADQVWHEQFGWIPEAHVSRYEQGERFYRGRWISANQDAELHREFSNPWIVRTEHYLVKTNHSLEKGVEIASRLERFYDFFVGAFAAFFWNPNELRAPFRGRGPPPENARPYEVHYYRTRAEYIERLDRKIPQIEMTNGLYYTADQIAYFYHDEESPLAGTLYHEATHQLMYEAVPFDRDVASAAHFWAIEGIACYVESFHIEEESKSKNRAKDISIGDPEHTRIVAARYRFLVDRRYIPLARFAAMGVREFQKLPKAELQRNYSQAAGLAHFFLHYDGGRYRDAFIEHLAQLYQTSDRQGRDVQNLAALTGVSYKKLDQEYAAYMQKLGVPRVVTQSAKRQDSGRGQKANNRPNTAPSSPRDTEPRGTDRRGRTRATESARTNDRK